MALNWILKNLEIQNSREKNRKNLDQNKFNEYIPLYRIQDASLCFDFFCNKHGKDRLRFYRVLKGSEPGIILNFEQAEKVSQILKNQGDEKNENRYHKGDCNPKEIENGEGHVWGDWRFEPIESIMIHDCEKISFKLYYKKDDSEEKYLLIREIKDRIDSPKWRRNGGGVEIGEKFLKKVAEFLDDCVKNIERK